MVDGSWQRWEEHSDSEEFSLDSAAAPATRAAARFARRRTHIGRLLFDSGGWYIHSVAGGLDSVAVCVNRAAQLRQSVESSEAGNVLAGDMREVREITP